MKEFERIKAYNKKYSDELDKNIRLIMPKLIEAFTNIYGEEHKDYIAYTIKNLKYIYFLPEKYLKIFAKDSKFLRNNDVYTIKYYLKYLRNLDYKSYHVKGETLKKFIIENYIAKSDLSYQELLENENIIYAVTEENPAFTFYYEQENIGKIILLPLYIIDLKTILHEINHSLNINAIGILHNSLLSPTLFSNVVTEEIINDYIANLVLIEYKKIGGKIPKGLSRYKIGNEYEYNYYLVNYLFNSLSPLVLESLISGRPKLFIELVGNKNYHHLCQLISILYKNGYKENQYIELINLIDKIYEKVIDLKPINYNEYYAYLESNGYRVRKL